ncbi:MAG TPA: DUF2089 domain-containing protein [Methylomirabilota bacterium]|nr:DUF2089 domain-containing protein [Methylomirabilota bacterium]
MARDVISTCPVCEGELAITRLHCRSCGTALEGEFGVGRFGRLSREQLTLLESFLRSRGNLKDLERELGISYPTVRGRIEALLRALGLADGDEPAVEEPVQADAPNPVNDDDADERRDILDRLARREISAEDAAAALRALGGA